MLLPFSPEVHHPTQVHQESKSSQVLAVVPAEPYPKAGANPGEARRVMATLQRQLRWLSKSSQVNNQVNQAHQWANHWPDRDTTRLLNHNIQPPTMTTPHVHDPRSATIANHVISLGAKLQRAAKFHVLQSISRLVQRNRTGQIFLVCTVQCNWHCERSLYFGLY